MVSILTRWAFAFALLAATFNPTQWNYVRLATSYWEAQMPLVVFSGLVLLIGYIIYLRATLRSIGALGMVLVAALVGTLVWALVDWGVLSFDNRNVTVWLGIVALSLILGVGLSWSIIRRRLSGQIDGDDVDE